MSKILGMAVIAAALAFLIGFVAGVETASHQPYQSAQPVWAAPVDCYDAKTGQKIPDWFEEHGVKGGQLLSCAPGQIAKPKGKP